MPETPSGGCRRSGWRLLAHVRNACRVFWKPIEKTTRNPDWYDPEWFREIDEDDSFVRDPFALDRDLQGLGLTPEEYNRELPRRCGLSRLRVPDPTASSSSSGELIGVHRGSGAPPLDPMQVDTGSPRKFKGVRQISTGKFVAEIRPTKSVRTVWIGTYDSKHAAARAYDVATFYYKAENDSKLTYNFGDPSDFVPALPARHTMQHLNDKQKKAQVVKLASNAAKRAEGCSTPR